MNADASHLEKGYNTWGNILAVVQNMHKPTQRPWESTNSKFLMAGQTKLSR